MYTLTTSHQILYYACTMYNACNLASPLGYVYTYNFTSNSVLFTQCLLSCKPFCSCLFLQFHIKFRTIYTIRLVILQALLVMYTLTTSHQILYYLHNHACNLASPRVLVNSYYSASNPVVCTHKSCMHVPLVL